MDVSGVTSWQRWTSRGEAVCVVPALYSSRYIRRLVLRDRRGMWLSRAADELRRPSQKVFHASQSRKEWDGRSDEVDVRPRIDGR